MSDSGKSEVLDILSGQVVGYIYTFIWSMAFLAQIRLNYKLKNTEGCNLDFVVCNFLGHIFYCIFVSAGYFNLQNSEVNGVILYDMIYAGWGVLMTLIILIQCFYKNYEKGQNRVSKICLRAVLFYCFICLLWAILWTILFTPTSRFYNTFFIILYFFIIITLTKYVPQIIWNAERKSTEGWSILMVQLDFLGGLILILQIILNAINDNDKLFEDSINLNTAKLALALVSILFGIFFMIQHYAYDPKRVYNQYRISKQNDLNMTEPLKTSISNSNHPFSAEMK